MSRELLLKYSHHLYKQPVRRQL